MSEVPETGPVSVDDVLHAIQQKNVGQARSHFNDLMGQKVTQSLDAEKVNIASQVFNNASEQPEEAPEQESEIDVESEIEDAFEEEEVNAESN